MIYRIRRIADGVEMHVDGLDGYPADAWEVLGETEQELPDGGYHRVADGEIELDAARLDEDLVAKVDREAGEFRCRFITDVPGQSVTYLVKEDEARRFKAAAQPDLALFPMLNATAEGRGLAAIEAADLIIATADSWRALAAKIEGRRERAKREIAGAKTIADKQAAAAVDWEGLLQ